MAMEAKKRLSDLEDEADALANRAETLLQAADTQETDTKHLLKILRENQKLMMSVTNKNGALLDEKRDIVCGMFMKEFEKLIKKSDTTGDKKIDEKELEYLILRLQTQLLAYGISEWDEASFRRMVKEDNGVDAIYQYCLARANARQDELREKGILK